MHPSVALLTLWLTTYSLSTPLYSGPHHPESRKFIGKHLPSPRNLDRQFALAAQGATLRKFKNAPTLLAGQGTSLGYTIPSSLQNAYDRVSDYVTNITYLRSLPEPYPYSVPATRVAAVRSLNSTNNPIIDPLEDETDGIDDYEYYGPMLFGSQAQPINVDFDTGSADLWVPVGCSDCQGLTQFQSNTSSTFRNSTRPFAVEYGRGEVIGTIVQDTVAVGSFKVANQTFGAVSSISPNFANSPSDGLIGLAFGTIATTRKPTFFENLIPHIGVPLFSIYMRRRQTHGSEICFGCIDTSKVAEGSIIWVPVASKTYWMVEMAGVVVNDSAIAPKGLNAIVDSGTSFVYLPANFASAVYAQIPGSAPALDYGEGFYRYPCDTHVAVSFRFGSHLLAMDPRDMNLGRHENDPTECIGAIVGATLGFAILGDSFCKNYVTIFDYSHGLRVGFMKSIG